MLIQVQCSTCGGGGALGVVTREMSIDGYGDARAEGQVIRCDTCGGQGWIAEEVEDE